MYAWLFRAVLAGVIIGMDWSYGSQEWITKQELQAYCAGYPQGTECSAERQ